MRKLLIIATILLVGAFALSSANAEYWSNDEAGYFCDGCRAYSPETSYSWSVGTGKRWGTDNVPDGWIVVGVYEGTKVASWKGDSYNAIRDLYYCGKCRVDPEQHRKLGANIMKNGAWKKEEK